jgi:flagellar basal body P-ring formation protein FlgA
MRRMLLSLIAGLSMATTAWAESVGIPVPNIAIRPGDALDDALLVDRKMTVSEGAARNYVLRRDQVVGWVARRALVPGAPIALSALRRPWQFKEGERVAVQFSAGGLSMRTVAIAMGPGIVGEEVSVRNVDTGLTVRGLVRGDGIVWVGDSR